MLSLTMVGGMSSFPSKMRHHYWQPNSFDGLGLALLKVRYNLAGTGNCWSYKHAVHLKILPAVGVFALQVQFAGVALRLG